MSSAPRVDARHPVGGLRKLRQDRTDCARIRCARAAAQRQSQPVPDQKLRRPVQPDMRRPVAGAQGQRGRAQSASPDNPDPAIFPRPAAPGSADAPDLPATRRDKTPPLCRCLKQACRAPRRASRHHAASRPRSWRAAMRSPSPPCLHLRIAPGRGRSRVSASMIAVSLRVLGVVQMIRLGRGEQDLLDPFAAQRFAQKRIPAGPERAKDIGHRVRA